MPERRPAAIDLMPPPFAEGLADWSRGDGTRASASYDGAETARIARGDPDFGPCLELRISDPVQRLRYMGELPLRPGAIVEVRARLKAVRGPLASARIAAWPGGPGGRGLSDLPAAGPATPLPGHGRVVELALAIGRTPAAGLDLAWDARALYAHIGLDLLGPSGAVVRIADLSVVERPAAGGVAQAALPGFGPMPEGAGPAAPPR